MNVSIEDVKKLKELSGIGLTDAKAALVEANGDFDAALQALRKKGITKAEKKGDREAREGLIDGYVHNGRIGALVEVNCETDFVARTDNFKTFVHNIALQVASMNPTYVSEEDIPEDEIERVRKEASERVASEGKPAEIADKIETAATAITASPGPGTGRGRSTTSTCPPKDVYCNAFILFLPHESRGPGTRVGPPASSPGSRGPSPRVPGPERSVAQPCCDATQVRERSGRRLTRD